MLYPLTFTKNTGVISALLHHYRDSSMSFSCQGPLLGSQAASSGWCCRSVSGSGSSHRHTFQALETLPCTSNPYLPVSSWSLRDMLCPENAGTKRDMEQSIGHFMLQSAAPGWARCRDLQRNKSLLHTPTVLFTGSQAGLAQFCDRIS